MIGHGEVNMESNAFAVMAAVTSDTEWEDDSARGEVEHFWTVELNYVEWLNCTISGSICHLRRVRITPLGAYTLCQFSGDTLCLCEKKKKGIWGVDQKQGEKNPPRDPDN
jgi:hypothetical protein